MKRTKIHLLLIALCGISLAWANKPFKPNFTYHIYSFENYNSDGSKMYYYRDVTSLGWTKGNQYACDAATWVCTYLANPSLAQIDLTGTFFYTSDVPNAGIDNSGFYYEF